MTKDDSPGVYLVLGHDGMLGRAWMELLAKRRVRARGVTYPQFDLTSPPSVAAAIDSDIAAVICCAAYTDVDGAEADEARATAVNGAGVGTLVERCDALAIPLVHYSTDYVFDGKGSMPYPTDHETNPVNAYGRSKLVGEQHVGRSSVPHLLVRTSWLYAPWAKNFVRTIANLATQREELKVVHDQRGRPTSAEHLARVSLTLLEKGARGTFHVTDGGECSWFEFAQKIAAHASPSCRVTPCTSAEFPRPAARPAYSVLDIAKTESLVGGMPHWQDNLSSVLRRST